MNTPEVNDDPIARALRDDCDALERDAKIPGAGLVYWRASIRARSEAARRVERPFTIAQGLAAAAVAGVGAALAGFAAQLPLPTPSRLAIAALGVAALVVISPLALVALALRTPADRD